METTGSTSDPQGGTGKMHTEFLVAKRKGKRPVWRHSCRLEDNIRNLIINIGWNCVDWIYVAQFSDKWRAGVKVREVSSVGEELLAEEGNCCMEFITYVLPWILPRTCFPNIRNLQQHYIYIYIIFTRWFILWGQTITQLWLRKRLGNMLMNLIF